MAKMQNFVIWIQTASLLMIFTKILQKMLNDDIYKDIAEDVETRFDASNFKLDIPFPQGKNKKAIGLMKDELGE